MGKVEMLPVVDVNGTVLAAAERSRCHGPERLLHPVVHLHVFDPVGKLLLQRRTVTKKIQPGKWDTAVGGHVDFGESIDEALIREVREEIGLEGFVPDPVARYVFESSVERELVNTFRTTVSSEFVPKREESDIDELRFFTAGEIKQMIECGDVTPNFAMEYSKYLFVE